jgi:hypothetical protein
VADAVGEQLPVARDAGEEDGGGFVFADIGGVDSTSSLPSRPVRMQMEPRFSFARRRLKK